MGPARAVPLGPNVWGKIVGIPLRSLPAPGFAPASPLYFTCQDPAPSPSLPAHSVVHGIGANANAISHFHCVTSDNQPLCPRITCESITLTESIASESATDLRPFGRNARPMFTVGASSREVLLAKLTTYGSNTCSHQTLPAKVWPLRAE